MSHINPEFTPEVFVAVLQKERDDAIQNAIERMRYLETKAARVRETLEGLANRSIMEHPNTTEVGKGMFDIEHFELDDDVRAIERAYRSIRYSYSLGI